jgi:acyl-[acyl-carrier-protein]-phospholipid O-acyltransferase/long-chain-fatty-acid--[acyl-carrier-protein] ligase
MKAFLKFLFTVIFRIEVTNGATFKGKKQLIICNHQSFLDGFLLGLFLPIQATYVVHTTVLHKWYFRFLLSFVNYLAVDTTKPMAMKKVANLISEGVPVVIFPEGRITLTGHLMKIYDGPAFIGYKTEADIISVWIDGAINSKFGRQKLLPRNFFPKITITIQPEQKISIDHTVPLAAKIKRKKAGEQMRKIMEHTMFLAQPKETLYQRVVRTAIMFGKNTPILSDKDQLENPKLPALTYNDVFKRTLGIGKLLSHFTQEKEVIGIMLPNVSTTPAIILGLNIFNRIPAMLNYTLGSQGLQSACETAMIKRIITSKKFVEIAKLEQNLQGLVGVEIMYLEDLKNQMTLADKLWLVLYAIHFPQKFGKKQSPEDTAVILFTSGSESKPKGVVLSNRALLANVDQCRTVIDLNPTDKVLNALPLFHSFGLTGGTLLPLLTGTPTVLYPSPLHYRVIPEVSYDKNCTVIFGTNTFLNKYSKSAHPLDFRNMRYVVAGAEKLTDEVRNTWFEKFGIRIFEGYGSTECAPVIAVNTPVACKFGTVGQLMAGMEYKILPVNGIEEGGEFHVKGPNLMSGYMLATNPGKVEFPHSEVGHGWYNTGDIVAIDSDGYVCIKGRMKRFIKIAGEMVPLEVIEKIARTASPNFSHACSSKNDPLKGESVVLFTTDVNLKREDLSKNAKTLGYTDLMVARNIQFIENIPVLGTGKTDYVSLKKLADATI